MYFNTRGQLLAVCILIHAANCAVSVNRIYRVYLRGHLHAANSSPRVQSLYTWRKTIFFVVKGNMFVCHAGGNI
jgi:hypothetical protein